MHDHPGHTAGMPEKPETAKPATPAKADPHAGHDMGKTDKPVASPKDAAKK